MKTNTHTIHTHALHTAHSHPLVSHQSTCFAAGALHSDNRASGGENEPCQPCQYLPGAVEGVQGVVAV
eukprot:9770830-Prorocentrum_lima.AAC.1